jgi:hypothetical protein
MFHYLATDPDMLLRPVQATFLVLGFKLFGRHALPYHIFNTALLGALTVCLYLTLRELQAQRWLGFAIALVFGLLPHYSTDRIWVSSQQAILCMTFALIGICALFRSIRPEEHHPKMWLVLAAFALVLSILSYEVALGLIAASVGMIAWRKYRDTRASSRTAIGLGGIAATAAVLLLVGMIKSRMQARLTYHHHFLTHLGALFRHGLAQALQFNLWTYGLHAPAVLVSLYRHSAISGTATVTAVLVAGLVIAYLWRYMESSAIPSRRTCLWLIVQGFAIFGLGYGLFFPGITVNFSTAGIANRVAIASAPGAAFILVAMAGLACSMLKSHVARARAFSFTIGAICLANCLIVSGIAFFWADAAAQQTAILKSVAMNAQSLPQGSVLLLDGFCRYSGPGIVFETDWDTTGAIRLALADFSLRGDVVSPNLRFAENEVETTLYGHKEDQYPYGSHLFVYNIPAETLTSLPSKEAADVYLRAFNPSANSGCPEGREGDGTRAF